MSSYGALAFWYDSLTGDIPYEGFADFYERVIKRRGAEVQTLLDLACGTGTLSCIMARRGYELISVDASPEMLAEAAEKVQELPDGAIAPMLLCQDMAELDLNDTVDMAVCCLDGFNYLPPEELPEVFHRLRLFVRPGGLLIFDINSPERLRSLDGGTFVDESDDVLCLWRGEFDEEENCLCYYMDIFSREDRLWRRDEEEHVEYAHSVSDLRALLEKEGFEDIVTSSAGPQHDQGRIFIIAKRGQ